MKKFNVSLLIASLLASSSSLAGGRYDDSDYEDVPYETETNRRGSDTYRSRNTTEVVSVRVNEVDGTKDKKWGKLYTRQDKLALKYQLLEARGRGNSRQATRVENRYNRVTARLEKRSKELLERNRGSGSVLSSTESSHRRNDVIYSHTGSTGAPRPSNLTFDSGWYLVGQTRSDVNSRTSSTQITEVDSNGRVIYRGGSTANGKGGKGKDGPYYSNSNASNEDVILNEDAEEGKGKGKGKGSNANANANASNEDVVLNDKADEVKGKGKESNANANANASNEEVIANDEAGKGKGKESKDPKANANANASNEDVLENEESKVPNDKPNKGVVSNDDDKLFDDESNEEGPTKTNASVPNGKGKAPNGKGEVPPTQDVISNGKVPTRPSPADPKDPARGCENNKKCLKQVRKAQAAMLKLEQMSCSKSATAECQARIDAIQDELNTLEECYPSVKREFFGKRWARKAGEGVSGFWKNLFGKKKSKMDYEELPNEEQPSATTTKLKTLPKTNDTIPANQENGTVVPNDTTKAGRVEG